MNSIDLSKFRYQNSKKTEKKKLSVGLSLAADDKTVPKSNNSGSPPVKKLLPSVVENCWSASESTPESFKTDFFHCDITCVPETPEQSEDSSLSPVFYKGKPTQFKPRSNLTKTDNFQMDSEAENGLSDQSDEVNNDRQSDDDYKATISEEEYKETITDEEYKETILSDNEEQIISDNEESISDSVSEEDDNGSSKYSDQDNLTNGHATKRKKIRKGRIQSSDEESSDNGSNPTDEKSENEEDTSQLRTCAKRKMRLLSDSAEDSDGNQPEINNEEEEEKNGTEEIDEEDLINQMIDVFPHQSKKVLRRSLVKNNWSVCDAVATVFEHQSSDDSDDSLPKTSTKKKNQRSKPNTGNNTSRWISKTDFRSVAVPKKPGATKMTNGNSKIKKRRRIEVNDSSDNEDEVEKPSKKKKKTVKKDSDEEFCLLPKARTSHRKKRVVATATTDIKWKKNLNGALASSEDESIEANGDVSSDEEGEAFTEEFKVKVVEFFNTSSVDEMVCIEGNSLKKAQEIASQRPFKSFNHLMTAMVSTKGLGTHLVENAEDLFTQRAMLVSLMTECSKITGNTQKLLATNLPRKDSIDSDNSADDEDKDRCIVKRPKLLRKDLKLKPYQVVGLNWLLLMDQQNVNGILADEMGLGKTIQTIAFLAHLVDTGKVGPHVIVVPSSTLDNWDRELSIWAPSLVVLLYFGAGNERAMLRRQLMARVRTCNIILTTYNVCSSTAEDRSLFRKLPIQYSVFDEAHFLKNMTSQRYVNLMKINATNRLLLTGTPLQNSLFELISLLSFTMPSLFTGKTSHLQRIFCMKKQRQGMKENEISTFEKERIAHAKKIMQPFVLRRVKADVLSQLPKKIEIIETCKLETKQEQLNNDLKAKLSRSLQNDSKVLKGAMMQLRKMANHPLLHRVHYDDEKLREMSQIMLKDEEHKEANPALIFEDFSVMFDYEIHHLCHRYPVLKSFRLPIETIIASGKLIVLDRLLPEMKTKNDRVLIFSQFVMMLDILEIYLQHRGYRYLRLDGQTPVTERLELIDQYNKNPDIFIFLLSTKAGGLGINLTSANTVILHDIDYNPYNDKQAEDRCHRVGQTKVVNVIRLISKNTIEEAMLKRAQYKLKLEKGTISGQADDEDTGPCDSAMLKEALRL
ncbi:SWI/SNF-related matrix-associated actin-dependent regulator of chromatin subfamily A containing DEAD/H box 1B-like [Antedon mediterranea]|uniref:SWI/SNF-related matrix-associated actin-dependent regulator of chromatin subfamily A containing DEAD/H box 1B-like n=1 Tax=Antedon mediterranea TaxID=105859 RepID=UPI003AF971DB